ncbi:hypothetical protein R1sor_007843 [Riccia sorocarpa]|uniref:Uncharacterized protein n=1 Tax=Riccia sorocarpa TaxID=122646 RepID=A0ABD3HUH7_9MARC
MKTMKKAQKRKRLEALTKSLMLQRSSLKTLTKALKISLRPCSDLTRPHPGDASAHATVFESNDSDQGSEDFSDRETMQRSDSTDKASKASARRNNTDISCAPSASSPIRLAPLQKSLGRKPIPASQRPDSTGKASKASARRNNTNISRAPIASSPIRLAPLQKSLGRKATPASEVKHLPASQNNKNSLPDHPELIDVSKIALKDLPQMLSDESYSTIALVILGCKTKADLGNKIGKFAIDLKTLSHRKAFNTKPLDEKIRMVVEDSIRRNWFLYKVQQRDRKES